MGRFGGVREWLLVLAAVLAYGLIDGCVEQTARLLGGQ